MNILVARVQFYAWYCEAVTNGHFDPLLTYFAHEV